MIPKLHIKEIILLFIILFNGYSYSHTIIQKRQSTSQNVEQPTQTQQQQKPTKESNFAPIYTSCLQPGKVALTFDDGPNPSSTGIALDILKKENIIGTFFVNGRNYAPGEITSDSAIREMIRRINNEGHIVGSHSYYHQNVFDSISAGNGTLEMNIEKLSNAIYDLIGKKPAYFRPPQGLGGDSREKCESNGVEYDTRTDTFRDYLGKLNMKIIMWGADTRDWSHKTNYLDSLVDLDVKLKGKGRTPANSSFIVLLHDVHKYSVETLLPKLIEHIREAGYEIIPLSECIGQEPYLDANYQPLSEMIVNQNGTNATGIGAGSLTAPYTNVIVANADIKAAITSKISIISAFIAFVLLYIYI